MIGTFHSCGYGSACAGCLCRSRRTARICPGNVSPSTSSDLVLMRDGHKKQHVQCLAIRKHSLNFSIYCGLLNGHSNQNRLLSQIWINSTPTLEAEYLSTDILAIPMSRCESIEKGFAAVDVHLLFLSPWANWISICRPQTHFLSRLCRASSASRTSSNMLGR